MVVKKKLNRCSYSILEAAKIVKCHYETIARDIREDILKARKSKKPGSRGRVIIGRASLQKYISKFS